MDDPRRQLVTCGGPRGVDEHVVTGTGQAAPAGRRVGRAPRLTDIRRLESLTGNVFAVAMTLLVFYLRVPTRSTTQSLGLRSC